MTDIEKSQEENKRLSKIIADKTDLISITAHQLRTSLSALKWILEMFIDKDFGELTAEQQDYMQKAIMSNERMITLVTDLLSLNHTDEPSFVLSKREIDMQKLLTETIQEFYGETHKKNVTLTILEPSSSIPLVKCDPDMMRVALQSVIENAIKYSRKNGTVSISIQTAVDPSTINISIHDNGIGINEADKPHIFERFYRAPNAKETENIGSGLGLFICKNILKQHWGSISFESTDDRGTTFFLTIPLL